MYGKIFESLFQGSMVGKGALVFAVFSYVIASQRPDREVGSQVRLNPKLLAATFGEPEEDVVEAIEELCAPDPESTTKVHGGRRLIKLGEFEYQVVNGAKYRAIRDEEMRRAQNRESQRKFRAKKMGRPIEGETEYAQAVARGASQEELDAIITKSLPPAAIPSAGFGFQSAPETEGHPSEAGGLPQGLE